MHLRWLIPLCLLPALPLPAAPTVVAGKVYDVGKLIYSTDGAQKTVPRRNDRSMCWAAAGSNLLQHWQDVYYALRDADKNVPNGLAADIAVNPQGTAYLRIYRDFLEQWTDGSGLNLDAFVWYLQGGQAMLPAPSAAVLGRVSLLRDRESGAYYSRIFTEPTQWHPGLNGPCGCFVDYGTTPGADMEFAPKTLAELRRILDAMLQTEGQAGLLAFMVYERSAEGDMVLKGGHAVSCWGYETDPAGELCALYLTDSDDRRLSAFRVNAQEVNGVIELTSDDPASGYAPSPDRRLVFCALSHINTPAAVAKQGKPASCLPDGNRVECNTQLTAPAAAPHLEVAAGENMGQTLFTATAPLAAEGDLKIQHGALVSLRTDGAGTFSFGRLLNGGQCRVAHAAELRTEELQNSGYCELAEVHAVHLNRCLTPGCLVLKGQTELQVGSLHLQPAEGRGAALGHGGVTPQGMGGMGGPLLLRDAVVRAAEPLLLSGVSLSGTCSVQAEQGVQLQHVVWTLPLPSGKIAVGADGVAEVDATALLTGRAEGSLAVRLSPADVERLKAAGATFVRFRFAEEMQAKVTAEGLPEPSPGLFLL